MKRPAATAEGHTAPSRTHTTSAVLLLVAVTCGAYLNADHQEFLFDSADGAIENHRSRDLWGTASLLWRHPLRPDSQLAHTTFALNYVVNQALGRPGFEVTGFLVVNVLVHAANACLVFFLVRAIVQQMDSGRSPPVWGALVPALVFAVHPIQASSVAYIMQRRGSLATAFYLLAVLAYLRARDFPAAINNTPRGDSKIAAPGAGSASSWPWRRLAVAAAVPFCYWLSFRSKALGLTLPIAILAIEFCLRAPDRRALRHYLVWMVAGVLATIVAMFGFLWSQGLFDPTTMRIGFCGVGQGWGPWTHFLTESRVFAHYWKLLLLPLPRWSCIDHQFVISRSLGEHYAAGAVMFHGLLLSLAVVWAWQGRTLAALGIFWFYIALIPYILLPQRELMVEYKTYLPSVGLGLLVAEGLRGIRARVPFAWQVSGLVVVASLLLATTIRRNAIYQSALNLWQDAAQKSPRHHRPRGNLGKALIDLGRYDEAIEALEKSLSLNPRSYKVHNSLGNALLKKGRIAEAMKCYAEAVRLSPGYAEGHNNLGSALAGLGRWEEAVKYFTKALEVDRDFYRGYNNLGTARAQEGKPEEALELFRKAVELNPDYAEGHCNLGSALAGLGEFDQAIEHFRLALRLEPDLPEAQRNLARCLEDAKRHGARNAPR